MVSPTLPWTWKLCSPIGLPVKWRLRPLILPTESPLRNQTCTKISPKNWLENLVIWCERPITILFLHPLFPITMRCQLYLFVAFNLRTKCRAWDTKGSIFYFQASVQTNPESTESFFEHILRFRNWKQATKKQNKTKNPKCSMIQAQW